MADSGILFPLILGVTMQQVWLTSFTDEGILACPGKQIAIAIYIRNNTNVNFF